MARLLFALGVGIAVAAFVWATLESAVSAVLFLWYSLWGRSLRERVRALWAEPQEEKQQEVLSEAVAFGVPRMPWRALSVAAGVGGAALFGALFRAPEWVVVGVLLSAVPFIHRTLNLWEGQARRRGEVRRLLAEMAIHLSGRGEATSLGEVLEAVARSGDDPVRRRLRFHLDRLSTRVPAEALRALAEDFRSQALRDLCFRLDVAVQGGVPVEEAARRALEDELERELAEAERRARTGAEVLNIPVVIGFMVAILGFIAVPLGTLIYRVLAR